MKLLPPNYMEMTQESKEWLAIRAGCVTSSRVKEAFFKKTDAKTRKNYRTALVAERLTGKCLDHYVSVWMREGKEKEVLAREAYQADTGLKIRQIGFVQHDTIGYFGVSPDGLVGDDGMVEFKCPKIETHIEYIIGGVIPKEYIPQMTAQLSCCADRQWNDFCSFHPDVPLEYQTFIVRLWRKDAAVAVMEAEVITLLDEVDVQYRALKTQRETEKQLRASLELVKK